MHPNLNGKTKGIFFSRRYFVERGAREFLTVTLVILYAAAFHASMSLLNIRRLRFNLSVIRIGRQKRLRITVTHNDAFVATGLRIRFACNARNENPFEIAANDVR